MHPNSLTPDPVWLRIFSFVLFTSDRKIDLDSLILGCMVFFSVCVVCICAHMWVYIISAGVFLRQILMQNIQFDLELVGVMERRTEYLEV